MPDDDADGTRTATFMRDVELEDRERDLYRVVQIDAKGSRTVIGRGLPAAEARLMLLGRHPMMRRKVGKLPDTRFDREMLEEVNEAGCKSEQ